MKPLQRVAFIGNHLPRRCGIATFTHDLHRAVAMARPDLETGVVAMTDPARAYEYPAAVRAQIRDDSISDYVDAAEFLNKAHYDVVSLQHEYGIFGGDAGGNIVELLTRVKMPIVTTLHTVLREPTAIQREVLRDVIDLSAKTVVMSRKGSEFLRSIYDVPASRIEVIPHGIPDFPFRDSHHIKGELGFAGKTVILTFGLLSPSKGIETAINAMPGIVRSCPNAVYIVLGATHPNLVRDQGEAYRDSLVSRVRDLGMEGHVVFIDRFVDQATLLDFISMCDVYVTPYLNEAQMTSGTLAYSFGLGKAVVSTPYWHAKELLGDGRGVLVPFGDAEALGVEVAGLLTNDVRRHAMRKRAYAESRSMTWAQTARRYLSVFESVIAPARFAAAPPIEPVLPSGDVLAIPELRLGHFLSLCDGVGMLQHATFSIPDRHHGYCVDDNARALLLASGLATSQGPNVSRTVSGSFAAFIQHAYNPEAGRFRNFMSYDRRWLEEFGSEDSHARTLWALAECARKDSDPSRRKWAASLFMTALPVTETFRSPRSWAFTLLGLDSYCASVGRDLLAYRLRAVFAERLMSALTATETADWIWFEDVLAYDNARLPQALIQTGLATETPAYLDAGVRTLQWLTLQQTTATGYFRPVGTASFHQVRRKPEAFDQQPVEAAATIAACLSAWRATGRAEWRAEAARAFGWFLGENDLQEMLIDPDTGSCADGLHPDRLNQNRGAESALSYLLSHIDISQFARSASLDRINPLSKIVRSAVPAPAVRTTSRGLFVSIPNLEPSELVSATGPGKGRGSALQAGDRTQGSQPG